MKNEITGPDKKLPDAFEPASVPASGFATRYQEIYESLLTILLKSDDNSADENALHILQYLANFAWKFHPGTFVDLRLESRAREIGQRIWNEQKAKAVVSAPASRPDTLLHVASETYSVGGHTRLLLNLIKGDGQATHSLVLTRQQEHDVADWLRKAVTDSGGEIISLAGKPYTERVGELQKLISERAGKLFYHIHPDDSVAVAALAAVPRPPVLTINHADHVFWLGSALSEVTVCIRSWSLSFSLAKRAAQQVVLLPIPLNFAATSPHDKEKARTQLGIQPGTVMILSVASAYKFTPSGQYNYYQTIDSVLRRNPQVIVKIVGIGLHDNLTQLGFAANDRVELLGNIPNPRTYYEAADIYLDSMPFSSFTSMFEAMYFNCFPVLQFDPVDTLNLEREPAFAGLVFHPASQEAQLQLIQKAIDDEEYRKRIAAQGAELIKKNYMGEGWKKHLRAMYDAAAPEVTATRDLRQGLDQVLAITQADEEAAALASSFNGNVSTFLLESTRAIIQHITIPQLVKLLLYFKKQNVFKGRYSTTRHLAWFFLKKARLL